MAEQTSQDDIGEVREFLRDSSIRPNDRVTISTIEMRKTSLRTLLFLFSLSTLTTLGLFVYKAISVRGNISEVTLLELSGMTLSQVASLLIISSRFLFRA